MRKEMMKETIIDKIRRAQNIVVSMDNMFESRGYEYNKIDKDLLLQWMRLGDKIVEEVAYSKEIKDNIGA